MITACHPLPTPFIGGPRGRERCAPGRVRRVAYYGPLAITYDCEDSPVDGECDRDVLGIAFVPNDWTEGRPRIQNADLLLNQALGALQAALGITADELIENAPQREET
ncbi:hypothetical protein GCM10023213_48500 [Prosthecobacter algae]|uniref:Uncharacterized protein n=1 Tax=Prosthecobacter algae TaxID=1144682 RepID=A0ABP9PPH2_9BACT